MNIQLINPNREQMPWPPIPIGLCMVATALRHAGHSVDFLDLAFSHNPRRDTIRAVRRRCPDVVGVTVRNIDNCNLESPIFYLTEIRDAVIRAVRTAAPTAKVVIGGSAVSMAAREALHYLEADYAVVGEGEEVMQRFVAALEAGEEVRGLPGVLKRGGTGDPISGRSTVKDLDPGARSEAYRWVNLRKYAQRGGPYSIQTKRGCALRCTYCVYNNIEGRKYRLRDPGLVADEIEEVSRYHGVSQVEFVDSTFNLPFDHSLALCDELASRCLPVELSTMGINPAAISPVLLRSMQRAGFRTVMCTPDSASDVTLTSLQKDYDKETVIRAAHELRRSGLRTFWFFLFGAPGETIETVQETLEFCEQWIPPTDVVLFATGIRVYARTPLERQLKESGWLEADDPLLWPSWFVSPSVDLEQLYSLLVSAVGVHPNWMTNAETTISPTVATLMKRGFSLLGWRGPFWTHLPKLLGLASRVGTRNLAWLTDPQPESLRCLCGQQRVQHRELRMSQLLS